MGFLRSIKQDASEPDIGPARLAFDVHRDYEASLADTITKLRDLEGAALEAVRTEQNKLDAVLSLRERTESAEVQIQAAAELGGAVDASPLADLKRQLAEAESDAASSSKRLRVEQAKCATLKGQLTELYAAQRHARAQRLVLGKACLREDLQTEIAACEPARAAYEEAFNRLFACAMAVDRMEAELQTGQFVGSEGWSSLCLPVVEGMSELPYSQTEHYQRLQATSVELLRALGLHE